MKLSELKHEVWKDPQIKRLGLRKDEVKTIVNVVVKHIGKGLLTYGKVKLQGLFTLEVKKAKGRKIANPQTGEHMIIDDYYKISLEPSKEVKVGLKEYKQK